MNDSIRTAVEEHIRQLENQLLQFEVRKSSVKISMLLADTFFEIGSSGNVYTKQQVIDALTDEQEIVFSPSEFKIVFLADNIILLTYKLAKKLHEEKNEFYSNRSSIWKLINEQWQLVFHQGTPCKFISS